MFKKLFNKRVLKASVVLTGTVGLGILGYFLYKKHQEITDNGPII